ncbi:hypothetical protein D6774_00260 [Candidatus Woesearchaeota archaeon]|nr:MAG: hypothetical protein D6774_00260 [Candidatus Woesearchaeota archaeon]
MTFTEIIISILSYLWLLFKKWLSLFAAPFASHDLIWIIIPVWLSWFFAEFFQEKKRTSFGNAISNGVVPFWVGFDWMRHLTGLLVSGAAFTFDLFQKYFISLLVVAYGCMIIYFGIKGKSFIPLIGRIREVTYVLIMFMPIIYGIIDLDLNTLLAILLYFPVYYFIIELIDHYTPDPKIYELDEGEAKQEPSWSSTSSEYKI